MSHIPEQDASTAPEAAEAVSVVMPVLNEERHLAEAVAHVLHQDYPGELELILALGPSTDATTQIAKQIAAVDARVIVVDNPSGKIPSAINAAIKAARHQIIARVDGHALLPPGYLQLAVTTLLETGAVNVGGIMAADGVTPFQQAVAWAMTSPFGVGSSRFHTGGRPGPVDTVYLGVFLRTAIERVGGYDEEYLRAEDWEMNHRIRQSGGLIWFQPALRVTYRPRASLARLGTQYFGYGRWRRVIARQYPGTISLRYLAPPAAATVIFAGTVAGIAGLAGLASAGGVGWGVLAGLGFAAPVGYGIGVLAASASAARQVPPRVAARLPLVLVTMHMCWGAGFLTSSRRLAGCGGQARQPADPARLALAGLEHALHERGVHEHLHEHEVREHEVREHEVREHEVREHALHEHAVHEHAVHEHAVHERGDREAQTEAGGVGA
jgi:succinoglycan biosynthesis protein ExoA